MEPQESGATGQESIKKMMEGGYQETVKRGRRAVKIVARNGEERDISIDSGAISSYNFSRLRRVERQKVFLLPLKSIG
jgi:hypothetical protein